MDGRLSWFYYFGRWLTWLTLRLFTRWKVRGSENVPASGPLLIVANHMNNADPPLIAVSIRRKMMFMAKEELFRSRLTGYFISNFGGFPVYRGRLNITALQRCKRVLDKGWCLVMFPEGMRSRHAGMIPAFPGSALIAAHNNTVILPVGITGSENIVGKSWYFKRPEVIVQIGKPFTMSHNGRLTKAQLESMTTDIMCRIADLLPPPYHGCYAAQVAARNERKNPSD